MVAGHAHLIFRRKTGEGGAGFVTDTALLIDRSGRFNPDLSFIPDSDLIMGIMAAHAVFILAPVVDLHRPVRTFLEVIHNRIMTGQAFIRMKEVSYTPGHIQRIGMEVLGKDIFVTPPAGGLTVCRSMKFCRINHPGCRGQADIQNEER